MDWIKNIKAIGFDLDGTLYNSNPAFSEEAEKLKNRRIADKLNVDEYLANYLFQKEYQRQGSYTKTLNVMGINGEEFFTDLWEKIDISKYIKKDPESIQVIQALKTKYKLFILSNSNRIEQIHEKLSLIGIDPTLFDHIVSTVGMNAVKPDPKPFQECLKLLNLEPKEVLYVGDRESTDINGAKGAGMYACIVYNQSTIADICIDNLSKLTKILTI